MIDRFIAMHLQFTQRVISSIQGVRKGVIVTVEPEVLMPVRNSVRLRKEPRRHLTKEEWQELRNRIRAGLKPGSWEEVYRMFGCSAATGLRDRKHFGLELPLDTLTVIWLSIFRQWCELYTGGHRARSWFFDSLADREKLELKLRRYGVLSDDEQLPETFQ